MVLVGGIEGGGTKFIVAVSNGDPTEIADFIEIPTTTPEETLGKALEWLSNKPIKALGIASFGPVDLNRNSKTYGNITATPKLKWKNTSVLNPFKKLNVPIGFDTDVNAAAIAEIAYGGHGNISSCCYITVGTGVGIGIVINKQPVSGLMHPEGGHIRVIRHPEDTYAGNCPYHKDCIEGLTNAAALAARNNMQPKELRSVPDNADCWKFQVYYLAQLCATLTLIVSPEKIVIAGGIFQKRKWMMKQIGNATKALLKGYVAKPEIIDHMDTYIVPSRFEMAGTVGALELAKIELDKHKKSKL